MINNANTMSYIVLTNGTIINFDRYNTPIDNFCYMV